MSRLSHHWFPVRSSERVQPGAPGSCPGIPVPAQFKPFPGRFLLQHYSFSLVGNELLSAHPHRAHTVPPSKGRSASLVRLKMVEKTILESTRSSDPLLTGRRARLKPTEGPDGMRKCCRGGRETRDFPSDGFWFWFPHICSKGFSVIASSGDLKGDIPYIGTQTTKAG